MRLPCSARPARCPCPASISIRSNAGSLKNGTDSLPGAIEKYAVADMGTGHTPLYRDMIDAIEHDREPVCSGIEGRKALELVLGIYESAASGKPVRFPLSRGSTMDYVGRFDR